MINILVITPIKHIKGVYELLEKCGQVTYLEDPINIDEIVENFDVIYTNPNKTKIFIGEEVINKAKKLKVICTASTGTNHIDVNYVNSKNIKILALTNERSIINKISSTAELAFALTLCTLRNIVPSYNSVLDNEWDYTKFIGRQMNFLTVGIIGYGRLGSIYSKYCKAFGSKILIYDPYIDCPVDFEQTNSLSDIFKKSDIISIHVHVNDSTIGMINDDCLRYMKEDAIIINTSRGDIVNELDLLKYLNKYPNSRYSTDVIYDEVKNRYKNPMIIASKNNSQILITPHIGGMTKEAQEIAYNHVAKMLQTYIETNNNVFE